MDLRNAVYRAADGSLIDCEVEHPRFGWIPFTADANDPEEHGRTIHARLLAGDGGEIGAYVPLPEPEYRRIVMRRVIVDRLEAAGKLDAAMAALDQAGTYTRERWYALRDGPFVDDPDTLALMAAIGADPDVILAPHEEDILVPVEPEAA